MNIKLQISKILKCLLGKEIVNSAINPSLKSMHGNWWPDLPPKSLRVNGIIDYYKERLVVEGYKEKEYMSFLDTQ